MPAAARRFVARDSAGEPELPQVDRTGCRQLPFSERRDLAGEAPAKRASQRTEVLGTGVAKRLAGTGVDRVDDHIAPIGALELSPDEVACSILH